MPKNNMKKTPCERLNPLAGSVIYFLRRITVTIETSAWKMLRR